MNNDCITLNGDITMDNLVAEAFDFSKAVYEEKFIDP